MVGVDIHAEGRGNRPGIHGNHILEIEFCFILFVKPAAGEHIHFRVGLLGFHKLRIRSNLNHLTGQAGSVGNAGRKGRCIHSFPGADDANDLQRLAFGNDLLHMGFVPGHILPNHVFFIVPVQIRHIHQPQVHTHQIIIGPLLGIGYLLHHLATHDVIHDLIQQFRCLQAQGVGHHVGDLAGIGQDHDHLIVTLRPFALKHLILGLQHFPVVDHFVENVRTHEAGHQGVAQNLIEQRTGIGLQDPLGGIRQINPGLNAVAVLDGAHRMSNLIHMGIQMLFEGCQIVGADLGEHLGNDLLFHHNAFIRLPRLCQRSAERREHGAHIGGFRLDAQGIIGQGIRLNLVNVQLKARRKGHNQRDADDTDGTGKGCQNGSCLLGPEVIEAQRHGSKEGHGGFAHVLMLRWGHGGRIQKERVGVTDDFAVLDPDDPVGILFRQFRVVGDHHHQTVPGHFLQQFHDLHAGFRVQRAGGFIGQQNIRIVDQGTGNGHTLHLAAGHLVGLFVELIAQAHVLQSLRCPAAALFFGDAGDGQGQFHVGKDGLMGNQIVALEHETDGVVAIGIPVPIRILLRGNTVDHQITAVVPVQTADDVQQCGLAGTAGAKNRHELIVPKIQTDPGQSRLDQLTGDIGFFDVHDLQHGCHLAIVAFATSLP